MALQRGAGLALGMLLATGAGAHDLPRGLSAPRPSTGCEAFGPGFQKVEGTETCIHIGGSVRVETTVSTNGSGGLWSHHSQR